MGKTTNILVILDQLDYALNDRCFSVETDRLVKRLSECKEGRYKSRIEDLLYFYQIENFNVFRSKLTTLMNYLGGK